MPIGAYIITPSLEVKKVPFKEWCIFMETVDNRIAQTKIGICLVSTIFLGLDHGYDLEHPIIFETIIFHPMPDAEIDFEWTHRKWTSASEAQDGHAQAVEMVSRAFPDVPVLPLTVDTGKIFAGREQLAEELTETFKNRKLNKDILPGFDECE